MSEVTRPVPLRIVRTYLANEIPAAQQHAARSGLNLEFSPETLSATMRITGPPMQEGHPVEEYFVLAEFDGYRALPPIWRFLDPRTRQDVGRAGWPRAVTASVMHGNGLLCAHWSRLAYNAHGGPHADWGAPSNWRNVRAGESIALTVPDMVDRLIRDVRKSAGRLAPLPEVA